MRPSTRIAPKAGVASTPNASPQLTVGALLAAPAHLVQAHRRDGADEREAGGQGKQERHDVVVEHGPSQHETGQRVDDAQEDHIAPAGREVVQALGEDVAEIGHGDPTNRRQVAVVLSS